MSTGDQFLGRFKDNWRQRARERTTFREQLRIVPRWLVRLLCALYVAALVVVFWIGMAMPNFPLFGIEGEPLALKLLASFGIVTALAIVVTAWVMLLGYIGCDARRRGMSPTLWVLVSLFVPYLVGAILYFVVREPLPFECPSCGRLVNAQFNFCPSCQYNLRPNCPQCRREIRPGDHFCPHCGFGLESGVAPALQTGVQPAR
ncbi:MAG TPA: zinc ribbon domain-containing protein [Terriglobia bacterium]|nr:zinc ribbon domain-containing protein [Terriglobia bacterium]